MGGIQNLLIQHKPGISKACKQNLEKKKKAAAHQQLQPGIKAFLTKRPNILVPPMVPKPSRVIAYDTDPGSSGLQTTPVVSKIASPVPDIYALNLLAVLEKAVKSLPAIPEANDSDELAVFAQSIPTNLDKENAWEFLDPLLNRFLGFDRSLESISEALRGGEKGLAGMVHYLRVFINEYGIAGVLLEGKVQRLIRAIQTR
jgi:hypothetical protein